MATNKDRIRWARKALDKHAELTCSETEAPETQAIDLLCNLRHWCDAVGVNFDDLNRIAAGHYAAEKQEDQHDGTN